MWTNLFNLWHFKMTLLTQWNHFPVWYREGTKELKAIAWIPAPAPSSCTKCWQIYLYMLGWYMQRASLLPLTLHLVCRSDCKQCFTFRLTGCRGGRWESARVLEGTSSCSALDTWSVMPSCVIGFGSAVDLGAWHVRWCLRPWIWAGRLLWIV